MTQQPDTFDDLPPEPPPEQALAGKPRVLLIESDPETARLYREVLADHFGDQNVTIANTLAQALDADLSEIDLALCDTQLPDGTGLEAMDLLLRRRSDLPVVLVTAEGVYETAASAIRAGAYDYVVKAGDYLFALPVVIEKNLELWRTRRENSRLQQELAQTLHELQVKNQQLQLIVQRLETAAATDDLTGLANRRAVYRALDRAMADAQRQGHDLSCVMIDLDGFKQLNDRAGHPVGDEMLKTAAKVLEANCRRSDLAGRLGGDEMVLVLPTASMGVAMHVARRVLDEFGAVVELFIKKHDNAPRVTMSVGVASLRHSRPADPDALVAQADHALYRAKQAGKARIVSYDPTAPTAPVASPTQGNPSRAAKVSDQHPPASKER